MHFSYSSPSFPSLSPSLRSLLIHSRDSTHPRERSYDRVTPSWVQNPSELARCSKKYPFVAWGHLPRLLPDIILLSFSFQSVIRIGLAYTRRPISLTREANSDSNDPWPRLWVSGLPVAAAVACVFMNSLIVFIPSLHPD